MWLYSGLAGWNHLMAILCCASRDSVVFLALADAAILMSGSIYPAVAQRLAMVVEFAERSLCGGPGGVSVTV